MPRFSVIVPVYNVDKYINKCIDSVLNQTYKNFELIVVDDGSPDKSPEICDRYAEMDERVKVIHKKNGGLVSARQEGANVAIGEYVVCVDGDDWISENCLELFDEVIAKCDADIVCCGSLWAYGDKNVAHPITEKKINYNRKQIEKYIFPKLIEDKFGDYFSPTVWAKTFRADVYKEMQQHVCKKINIGEDHVCTKPIVYKANKISIIPECLYYYRQNDFSMTKMPKPFLWEGPLLLSDHMEKAIPMDQFDFQDQVYRFTIHNLFNVCVSQFNKKEPYFAIRKDIINHINLPYYKIAAKNCNYNLKNWKGILAKIAVKYKLILLMYIYNKKLSKH